MKSDPVTTPLSINQDIREDSDYCVDGSPLRSRPAAVVQPSSANEIPAILAWAQSKNLHVVCRGGGTGTVGGSLGGENSLVVDTSKLNKCSIDLANGTITAQAGCTIADIISLAEQHQHWYPVDPSSAPSCTIGGNVATNASGPRSFALGPTRNWIRGLRGYLADGTAFELDGRVEKTVSGYDIAAILCGSEGTLAMITEIVVAVLPAPTGFGALLAFCSPDDCWAWWQAARSAWPRPLAIEMFDAHSAQLLTPDDLPAGTMAIMIEWVDQSPRANQPSEYLSDVLQAFAADLPAPIVSQWATDSRQHRALWAQRKAMSPRMFELGECKLNDDLAVPLAVLPEFAKFLADVDQAEDFNVVWFGHAGQANLHINVMHSADQIKRAREVRDRIFAEALRCGGVVSGEHGIGLAKREWLARQLNQSEQRLMTTIKQALDPDGVLNVGKVLVDD